MKATVIIPNYNGIQYIEACLDSLKAQSIPDVPVIVVDNASADGSPECIEKKYPWVQLIRLDQNFGFCRAVNEGIRAAQTEYVILMNNDMTADPEFVRSLLRRITSNPKMFSCQALMLQMDHPDRIDSAGDFYAATGWAFTRGKNAPADSYPKAGPVFTACGGAVIYRKALFDKLGLFDEAHFAYLEDVDVGYRAQICGYENWYEPAAKVLHKGSAASGSRYNKFKVSHSSANTIYVVYKNMARWQILINLPFLFAGCVIKFIFFLPKGLGFVYLRGLWKGVLLARQGEKFDFIPENFDNCWKIQLKLWANLGKLLRGNK